MNNNSNKDIQSELKYKEIEEDNNKSYSSFYKKNKEYLICIIIIFIMLIGIGIIINILTVSVPNNEQIKSLLLNKELNIEENIYNISEENLQEIKVISRVTDKNVSDSVYLKLVINTDGIIYEAKGTVNFKYTDEGWVYDSSSKFDKIKKNYTEVDFKQVITKDIIENGISCKMGTFIPKSFISKVGNIKFTGKSYKENREFSAEVILSNGACMQHCNINAETDYNTDTSKWNLINIDLEANNRIIRSNQVNEESIRKEVLEEILDGGVFNLDNSLNIKNEVIYPKAEDIIELNILEYVVREDNSIRTSVAGKIRYKDEEVPFGGFVNITGRLSLGVSNNSKDITLYKEEKIDSSEYDENIDDTKV